MKETLIETLVFLLDQARVNAGPGPVAHRAQNLADRLTAHLADANAEEGEAIAKEATAEPGAEQ